MPRFNKWEMRQLSTADEKTLSAVKKLNKSISQAEAIVARKNLVKTSKPETLVELSKRRAFEMGKQSGNINMEFAAFLLVFGLLMFALITASELEDQKHELKVQNKLLQQIVLDQSKECKKEN